MQRLLTRVNMVAIVAIVLAAALIACNPADPANNTAASGNNGSTPTDGGGNKSFKLAKAPEGDAIDVTEAAALTPSDDVIVVRGRVKDAVAKMMSIQLADKSQLYCGQDEPCGCLTPWDYC